MFQNKSVRLFARNYVSKVYTEIFTSLTLRGTIETHVLTFFPFSTTSQVPHCPLRQSNLTCVIYAHT